MDAVNVCSDFGAQEEEICHYFHIFPFYLPWSNGITDSMDMSLSERWELVMDRQAWRAAIHGFAKSWTWLSDWTELNWMRPDAKILVF